MTLFPDFLKPEIHFDFLSQNAQEWKYYQEHRYLDHGNVKRKGLQLVNLSIELCKMLFFF